MSVRLLPLILLIAFVQSPASSQERLKPLEFLIGEWESTAQVNGQDVKFVAKWDWSLNRNFVASEMSIIADGTAVFKTTGMNAWDAKDQELLGWGFHSDGKYFRSKVITKEDQVSVVLGGVEHPVKKGSLVHIPPGVVHGAARRMRVLVVGVPDIADDDYHEADDSSTSGIG